MNGVLLAIEQIAEKLRRREQNYHFVELTRQDIAFVAAHSEGASVPDLGNAKLWLCQVAKTHRRFIR